MSQETSWKKTDPKRIKERTNLFALPFSCSLPYKSSFSLLHPLHVFRDASFSTPTSIFLSSWHFLLQRLPRYSFMTRNKTKTKNKCSSRRCNCRREKSEKTEARFQSLLEGKNKSSLWTSRWRTTETPTRLKKNPANSWKGWVTSRLRITKQLQFLPRKTNYI